MGRTTCRKRPFDEKPLHLIHSKCSRCQNIECNQCCKLEGVVGTLFALTWLKSGENDNPCRWIKTYVLRSDDIICKRPRYQLWGPEITEIVQTAFLFAMNSWHVPRKGILSLYNFSTDSASMTYSGDMFCFDMIPNGCSQPFFSTHFTRPQFSTILPVSNHVLLCRCNHCFNFIIQLF